MDAQRTPDAMSTENELICEKLLGWNPLPLLKETSRQQWYTRVSAKPEFTPSFATWAEAGLILDAFESRAPIERVDSVNYKSAAGQQLKKLGVILSRGELRPLDIRTAALKYVQGQLP